MGKLYCIIGKHSQDIRRVRAALYQWAEQEGHVSFSKEETQNYNLYLYDYLLETDLDGYREQKTKYGEEKVIPICLRTGEEDTDAFADTEIFQFYNPSDFKTCMQDIIAAEFSDYAVHSFDYELAEHREEIVALDEPEEVQANSLENRWWTSCKDWLRRHKKILLPSMVLLLSVCIIMGIMISEIRNKQGNSSRQGVDVMQGEAHNTYVVFSNGAFYQFEYTDSNRIKTALCQRAAMVLTNFNQLFYAGMDDCYKISENVLTAAISDDGSHIYYVTDENQLFRHNTVTRDAVLMDTFSESSKIQYFITVSPNGRKAAVNRVPMESFTVPDPSYYFTKQNMQHTYYDGTGNKKELQNIRGILSIADTDSIYAIHTDGWICHTEAETSTRMVQLFLIEKETTFTGIFNAEYTEFVWMEGGNIYLYYPQAGKVDISGYTTVEGEDVVRSTLLYDNISAEYPPSLYMVAVKMTSFKDLFYYSNNKETSGALYQLSEEYHMEVLTTIPEYDFNTNLHCFQDGSGLYAQIKKSYDEDAGVIWMDSTGNTKKIFESTRHKTVQILGVTPYKSVYYLNDSGMLYYKKGLTERAVHQFENKHLEKMDMLYELEEGTDSFYFLEGDTLYCSSKGGKSRQIMKIESTNHVALHQLNAGIYLTVSQLEDNGVLCTNVFFIRSGSREEWIKLPIDLFPQQHYNRVE